MLDRSNRTFLQLSVVMAVAFLCSCHSSSQPKVINLTGAGSSFVNPIMARWIADYQQTHPDVQINYQSIGSGGGIQQLKNHLVDFGASDAPLSDEQLKDMQPLIQIAESAGPVCITYNLPELKQPLKLTPEAIAGIYLGKIKKWRDPAIMKANPGVSVPDKPVVVVHRSEGSGTTNIFTSYLAAVSPEWAQNVGKGISVSWPVGLGGKGSEAVTGLVRQNAGGIGYVELAYATQNHLPTAQVKNSAGNWILPTAEGASAAIVAFKDELDRDLRAPIVQPPAAARDAYPLSGMTYLLIPKNLDKTKQQALKAFVEYVITTGQQSAAKLDYSQIPESLKQADEKLLNELPAS